MSPTSCAFSAQQHLDMASDHANIHMPPEVKFSVVLISWLKQVILEVVKNQTDGKDVTKMAFSMMCLIVILLITMCQHKTLPEEC